MSLPVKLCHMCDVLPTDEDKEGVIEDIRSIVVDVSDYIGCT